jgi:NodT family efflux transporter outer membrane factor (OMF) lipoprotein
MKMNLFLLLTGSTLVLSGCVSSNTNFPSLTMPQSWVSNDQANIIDNAEISELKNWWKKLNDKPLNKLVEMALDNNPDRAIAQSRVAEARGIRMTTRSSLFPEISARADGGRQDTGLTNDNYYEAGFDASFEIDVFGVNRHNVDAANASISALDAQYHDTSLTLVAEVVRVYADFRGAQKQVIIAEKNLTIQQETLDLINRQYNVGEVPLLDVERSEALVNTTASSIPEFKRQADNLRLQMTILTGALPADIIPIVDGVTDIAALKIDPVLMSPASVLRHRPDVRAAIATLAQATSLSESAAASIFPTFSLSGFYGIAESALVNATNVWTLAGGTALSLLNFGRIEGEIDAAREREKQAFEIYRKSILSAVVEVEIALVDYTRLNTRGGSIQKAYNNANNALKLSQQLYSEGEISFIDLLDAQRTLNSADSARVSSEQSQVKSVIRLYKSLGVY